MDHPSEPPPTSDERVDRRWHEYLQRFHADAPGITERVLSAARDDGVDAYAWTADAIGGDGLVVDLACGSAPLAAHLPPPRYLGIDSSPAELELAHRRVAGRLVLGDAAELPVPTAAADTVAASMALMLVQPLRRVLAEARRVLRPGGTMVALTSAGTPAGAGDVARWGALLLALGRTSLAWPNPQVLAPARTWLPRWFDLVDDSTRTFRYPLRDADAARLLVSSLYLPDLPRPRIDRAAGVAGRWLGDDLGITLRRVVARAPG